MAANPDLETLARLDRCEEALEMCAQLLAHGRDIGRLRLNVGQLEAPAKRLVEIILENQREKATRLETRPVVGKETRA